MNWEAYPDKPNWIRCTQYSFDILVRVHPLPGGYMWQVHDKYGYGQTIEDAKEQATKQTKLIRTCAVCDKVLPSNKTFFCNDNCKTSYQTFLSEEQRNKNK